MVAEERITTKFSGLVGAYGSEEEATFLATQQVDEARHMQFYARFQDEVISEPAVIAEHVERARARVSPAFRAVFDDKLVAAHNRLVADHVRERREAAVLLQRGGPAIGVEVRVVGRAPQRLELGTDLVPPRRHLLGVDAFDQPGVELGKQFAYAQLGRPGADAAKKEWESLPKADPRWIV